MEKKDIVDKIMDVLCDLTVYHSSSGGWTSKVIYDDSKPLVREALLKVFNECHDEEVGELRAKVYAYEKIIANSNFAPILDDKQKRQTDTVDCEGFFYGKENRGDE